MSKPPLRYRLLLLCLSPVFLLHVIWLALKHKNSHYALQRLGLTHQLPERPIWIHCASVGEVNAATPLVNALAEKLPNIPILVTTTTPTGGATVCDKKFPNTWHSFLPIDYSFLIGKLVRKSNPRLLLLVETELWPNLINQVSNSDVPVVVVNARLSERTTGSPSWTAPVYRQVALKLDHVLARSEADMTAYIDLGVSADKVKALGNLKYAIPIKSQRCADLGRVYWLAASTHDNEEEQLVTALKDSSVQELLVIAPRHPDRSEKIQAMLKKTAIPFAVRSKNELADQYTQVYLADTLGEMDRWMGSARLVFMGGSLVPVGGHNLLEPAACQLPILTGPHLDNVTEEAELLLDAGGMVSVTNASELLSQVAHLLIDTDKRHGMGVAAHQVVRERADVLDRYLNALLPLISVD